MSCAKMAEPIEKRFGMLSRVGPKNMYYMGIYTVGHKKGANVFLSVTSSKINGF